MIPIWGPIHAFKARPEWPRNDFVSRKAFVICRTMDDHFVRDRSRTAPTGKLFSPSAAQMPGITEAAYMPSMRIKRASNTSLDYSHPTMENISETLHILFETLLRTNNFIKINIFSKNQFIRQCEVIIIDFHSHSLHNKKKLSSTTFRYYIINAPYLFYRVFIRRDWHLNQFFSYMHVYWYSFTVFLLIWLHYNLKIIYIYERHTLQAFAVIKRNLCPPHYRHSLRLSYW